MSDATKARPTIMAKGPLTVAEIVRRTGMPVHLVQRVVRREPRR